MVFDTYRGSFAVQRIRALFVSPRFPFPVDQGGKIRTVNILRHMKGGPFRLVFASPAPKSTSNFAEELDSICYRFVSWPSQNRSKMSRVLALASRLPVSVARDCSPTGARIISQELLNSPEIIMVEFPHSAVLLPQKIHIPSVMFTHNIEAEILERHAELTGGVWRTVWASQARKMRLFEAAALRRFDRVLAVSEREADRFREDYGLSSVEPIGTGTDFEYYKFSSPELQPKISPKGGQIVFVGVMESSANIDAVEFLIDEIWPRVLESRPDARALIVGRGPPRWLVRKALKKGFGLKFTDFVDDVRPYVHESHISVIPIRAGSGTRIKAFEAMALGRPVVSTRVGIEGLDVTPDVEYLLADDAASFSGAILKLLENRLLRVRIAHAARDKIERNFSWALVAREAEKICLDMLKRRDTVL